ncbi:MAG: hypothetical protein E7177_05970 [Erysipelotrichaceae bacterium]|nr:hypothetical protein [Erysipelotrichaceae bacterium]
MDFRKKLCAATFFLVVIAHMILGYTLKHFTGSSDGYWYGFLLYILVPAMPFLVGLKKIKISFEFAIAVIYFTICISVQVATKGAEGGQIFLWHPLWVLFLLIPVYHIFVTKPRGNIEE